MGEIKTHPANFAPAGSKRGRARRQREARSPRCGKLPDQARRDLGKDVGQKEDSPEHIVAGYLLGNYQGCDTTDWPLRAQDSHGEHVRNSASRPRLNIHPVKLKKNIRVRAASLLLAGDSPHRAARCGGLTFITERVKKRFSGKKRGGFLP